MHIIILVWRALNLFVLFHWGLWMRKTWRGTTHSLVGVDLRSYVIINMLNEAKGILLVSSHGILRGVFLLPLLGEHLC